jgi:nucleoside-triphosphatase THEP1
VAGSIWAANEIVLGSFLHNLRIPLSGTFMAFLSVAVMVSFSMMWKDKGLIIRAGLIAALMKSISPSAIIIGPMVGIVLEAAFLQLFVTLLGRNIAGYALGGAFAVSGVLFQKVGRLLISYGAGFLEILDSLFHYAVKQLGLSTQSPVEAVLILVSFYAFWGVVAAVTGFYAGKKARNFSKRKTLFTVMDGNGNLFEKTTAESYSVVLLVFHFAALITGMYLINTINHWISLGYVAGYIGLVISRYRRSLKRLQKPAFWIWFVAITFLAALFLDNNESGFGVNGLIAGLLMNLRAAMVLFSFAAISTELKNPLIKAVMYRRGAASFYRSLELAFGILPAVTSMFPEPRSLMKKPVESIVEVIGNAEEVLKNVREQYENKSKVLIISGGRRQGKTSFIKSLTGIIKDKTLGGIITETDDNSEAPVYYLKSIDAPERYILCSPDPATGSLSYGRFYFNRSTIERGNNILLDAAGKGCDILIIDEVGPLEMNGKGWAPAIEQILKNTTIPMIWTVRSSLAGKIARRWNTGKVTIIDVNEKDMESKVLRVVNKLS